MEGKESKTNGGALKPVIPQNIVTEDHVKAALTADKGPNASLTAWKVVDFTKKGDNYACVVTSVEVKYVLDGKSSEVVYVVKLSSGMTFGSEGRINDLIFESEYLFYSELVPQMNAALKEIGQREINMAKYYHGSLEKDNEMIVLEDLRKRGYKMVDRRRGIDKAHTLLVVQELARFHAASLLVQNKTDQDLVEKYPYLKKGLDYYICNYEAMQGMIDSNLKLTRDVIRKVEGYERVIDWIDTILPRAVDIFVEQMGPKDIKTVCHGDCWNNNLLFRYNQSGHPEGVMLVDLQIVNRSPPTVDLNYLLFTSMTGDVRKPNIEEFLRTYYTTFSNIMEAAGQKVPFTEEQLFKEFRARNLVGALFAIMSLPVLLFEPGDKTVDSSEISTDTDFSDVMREVNENALASVDTNTVVKERFLSVFDELIELGVIS